VAAGFVLKEPVTSLSAMDAKIARPGGIDGSATFGFHSRTTTPLLQLRPKPLQDM